MALVSSGPAVGQISGSIGGTVFSRNRYGSYIRNRTKPVVSTTQEAQNAKARLGNISAQWQARTSTQRLAWQNWAQENPVVNRLGQSIVLTGHAAYVQINTRIEKAGGTILTDPPISPAPVPFTTLAITTDIGTGTFDVAFAATPLGATERLWLTAAVVDSAGINYTKNKEKNITITALAQTSPYTFDTDLSDRFGTLQVGQKVVVFAATFDEATGLLATPQRAESIIVDSP